MGKRIWHYAETLAEQNTTVQYPDWEDAASLTFMPKPNSTYLLLATGGQSCSGTFYRVHLKFYSDDPDISFVNHLLTSPGLVDARFPVFFCTGVISFGASPSEFTCKIAHSLNTVGFQSLVKNIRIVAIKLEKNDQSVFIPGSVATTSDSWQEAAKITFTPEKEGDYLVIARATQGIITAIYTGIEMVCDIDDVEFGMNYGSISDGGLLLSWGHMELVTLSAESKTIQIKFRSTLASKECSLVDPSIVVIRVSDFLDSFLFAKDDTEYTVTSTALETVLTLNKSFDKATWFVMGLQHSGGPDGSGESGVSSLRLYEDDILITRNRYTGTNWSTGKTTSYCCAFIQEEYDGTDKPNLAFAATSKMIPLYIKNLRIVAINLDAPYIYPRDQVRISAIDGNAFFDVSEYDTLTDCVGGEYKITVTDSTGKKLIGYIDQTKRGENYE